jgi:hypothetical protein
MSSFHRGPSRPLFLGEAEQFTPPHVTRADVRKVRPAQGAV